MVIQITQIMKGLQNEIHYKHLNLVERLTAETPALFLLKDFNRFLTDVSISRKLKNISRILKLQPKTIIIIGSEFNIPKEFKI